MLLALGLTNLLYACSDGQSSARLDIASPTADEDAESDDEWLREQQRLTIRFTENGGTPTEKDATLEQALTYISQYCVVDPQHNGCNHAYHDHMLEQLCVARTALAISTAQATPVTFTWTPRCNCPTPQTFTATFDRITEANAADFAGYAADFARIALDTALTKLEDSSANCHSGNNWVDNSTTSSAPPNPRVAQKWASGAVEAYYLARSAYDRAVEANLAMSDSARSSSASPREAARRSLLLQKYSRAATAHLLVGGDNGLLGSTTTGYCAGPRLAPKAQAALQLLRDAAPNPAAVLSQTLSIQDLLAGGTVSGGAVRQRLAGLYKVKALGWNTMSQTVGPPSQPLESYYDLTEADFTQARDFLQQEVSVFNRSLSAKLPAVNGVQRYAGTAGLSVSAAPAGAWTARARHAEGYPRWYSPYGYWPMVPNGSAPHTYSGYRTPPLETLIGETYARVRKLIRTTQSTFSLTGNLADRQEVLGLLGSITLADEVKGAIEMMVPGDTSLNFVRTIAHGYEVADKVRVVVGEDGLRCAVQGQIEGATCNDALSGSLFGSTNATCAANPVTLSCLTLNIPATPSTATATTYFGTTKYVDGKRTGLATGVLNSLIQSKTRVFFVKLKAQGLPEAPGNYELMTGGTLNNTQNWTDGTWDIAYPVIPSLDDKVAEVLEPNRQNCTEQAVNCLGKRMDARIPLEDELTDDGNGFENSWRHYLALARQAADETALLGREYRDARLNELQTKAASEQRAEEKRQAAINSLQEAQNICGTALDTDKLLTFLSRGTSTTVPDGGLGAVVSTCNGSRCVVDLAKLSCKDAVAAGFNESDCNRFRDCLDDSAQTLEPFVNLGSVPVCVSKDANNALTVTDSDNGQCSSGSPSFPLKFFTKPTGVGMGSTVPNACVLLREARGSHSTKSVGDLVKSGVFNFDRLKDRVGQLGFRAEFGGFFAITEDKSPRFTSGNAIAGRSPGWPWAASTCPSGSAGLFCYQLPAQPALRDIGEFNARAYRATYAAAAVLDEGLESIYPAQDDMGNSAPCDGKEHETEYHKTSAEKLLDATTPVWTCAGRKRENLRERLKYDRSVYPRVPTPLIGWILADGGTLPGSSLNLWGYGSPYCQDTQVTNCYGSGVRGSGDRTCTTTTSTHCDWNDLSVALGGSGMTKAEALAETWGGLSAASTFPNPSTVYAALANSNAETSRVLFEGGQDKDYMSPGKWRKHGNFGYYRTFLDVGAVLDGLEILCELDRLRTAGSAPGGTLDLTSVEVAADALTSAVEQLSDIGGRMTFANVPKTAVADLSSTGPTGAFPSVSGDMGEAVSALRQGLITTQHSLPIMSGALRSMATEMRGLTLQLQISQTQSKVIDWDTMSEALLRLKDCASEATDGFRSAFSFGTSVAIECAHSAAQMAISLKKSALQKEILESQDELARNSFIERMSQIISDLEQSAISLAEAREGINGSLSRIDGIKKSGRLAVAKALYLSSYESKNQQAYDNAVGALESLAKRRFDQSLKNAKLMSFMARRAIEQRLGLFLKDQGEDLPLVRAPALWEGEACSYNGFQTPRVQSSKPNSEPAENEDWVATFGNGFIGDYVTNLENFVESYRINQSFHEGKDTAVISLRDDVKNVRAECSVQARNLFKSAGEMNAPAWRPRTCNPVTNGAASVPGINCISAVPRMIGGFGAAVPDLAVRGLAGSQEAAAGYRLQFGDGVACNTADSGGCGWKPGSALGQIVQLIPGRYRLSWYTQDDATAAASVVNGAKKEIFIIRGTATPASSSFTVPATVAGPTWKRASLEFTVAVDGEYEVGFGLPSGNPADVVQQVVTIGAPMLERLPTTGGPFLLGNFQATDENGVAVLPDCEDTDGAVFRLKHFTRECVRLCTDGFTANCSTGPEHCYRELNFGVSQAALQNGRLLNYSGFARGNFNYRIDSLGINFVGSSIRNCENVALPSTCYNAGFVPYSLHHNGPFYVRNRAGEDFPAMLFDGRIEHARGLALDRYFTSPISSTDRELMADFMRGEFSGRPLDGNFSLRIWEDQGFDFSSIQDVQLVLNYRYWTAFN